MYLSNNKFTSQLSWSEYITLNPSIKYLFISNNDLYGPINFDAMPGSLIYCFLGHNKLNALDFENITNLEVIPSTLKYLHLNDNNMRGEINDILSALAGTQITSLSLGSNRFTGNIDWDIFKDNAFSFDHLKDLYVYSNQLRYLTMPHFHLFKNDQERSLRWLAQQYFSSALFHYKVSERSYFGPIVMQYKAMWLICLFTVCCKKCSAIFSDRLCK